MTPHQERVQQQTAHQERVQQQTAKIAELLGHLEPIPSPIVELMAAVGGPDAMSMGAQYSIAVSLKRLADCFTPTNSDMPPLEWIADVLGRRS